MFLGSLRDWERKILSLIMLASLDVQYPGAGRTVDDGLREVAIAIACNGMTVGSSS